MGHLSCFVPLFVIELIIFICHVKRDPVCKDFPSQLWSVTPHQLQIRSNHHPATVVHVNQWAYEGRDPA